MPSSRSKVSGGRPKPAISRGPIQDQYRTNRAPIEDQSSTNREQPPGNAGDGRPVLAGRDGEARDILRSEEERSLKAVGGVGLGINAETQRGNTATGPREACGVRGACSRF